MRLGAAPLRQGKRHARHPDRSHHQRRHHRRAESARTHRRRRPPVRRRHQRRLPHPPQHQEPFRIDRRTGRLRDDRQRLARSAQSLGDPHPDAPGRPLRHRHRRHDGRHPPVPHRDPGAGQHRRLRHAPAFRHRLRRPPAQYAPGRARETRRLQTGGERRLPQHCRRPPRFRSRLRPGHRGLHPFFELRPLHFAEGVFCLRSGPQRRDPPREPSRTPHPRGWDGGRRGARN